MRKLPFMIVLAAMNVGLAQAADLSAPMPVKALPRAVATVYDWTGFYVGVNAGAAWTSSDVGTTVCNGDPRTCYWSSFDPTTPATVMNAGRGHFSDTLFTGGAQIGANWQREALVLGVEADINSFHLRAARSASTLYGGRDDEGAPNLGGATLADSVSTNYLATVRGRLGYAAGTLLVYATGGAAFADVSHDHSYGEFGFGSAPPCVNTNESSNFCAHGSGSTHVGWTAGAGAEWAFAGNWTMKAEYLHVDLGNASSTSLLLDETGTKPALTGGAQQVLTHSASLTADLVRFGVNYRFASPAAAAW